MSANRTRTRIAAELAVKKVGALLTVSVCGLLAGCETYSYEFPAYLTDDWVVAERDRAAAHLANVRVVAQTLPGSALVEIPSFFRVCPGGRACPEPTYYDAIVAEMRSGIQLQALGYALVRGQVFQSTLVANTCTSRNSTDFSTDWTVWALVEESGAVEWYVRHNASGRESKVPIDQDVNLATGMAAWVDAVSATAIELDARTDRPPRRTSQLPMGNQFRIRVCDSEGGQQSWTVADAVQVSISPDEFNRVDMVGLYPAHPDEIYFVVWTGPIWAGPFVGTGQSSPTFTINSTNVKVEHFGLAMHRRFHYIFDGVLSWNGRSYPVSGEASAEPVNQMNTGTYQGAVYNAAQQAVADAARQVKAILDNEPAAAP